MKISDDHSLTPPSRPPPPSSHSIPCLPAEGNTPKRPPPPSSLLSSKEISDRPQQSKSIKTSQSESDLGAILKNNNNPMFNLIERSTSMSRVEKVA
ncbi:unnamed protein product [Heterobilharzia americana]|nr:unnamed protein product [Heterobilharzia americana]